MSNDEFRLLLDILRARGLQIVRDGALNCFMVERALPLLRLQLMKEADFDAELRYILTNLGEAK